MTNFDFLKKIDSNLYEIVAEAEKLYASEFFEQCMGQTRRFGEQMCKAILADRRQFDGSFDEMLATLKDQATTLPEKEFIDDLYFLKKQGNLSVHSSTVKHDGMTALECLQRAFEAAINYAVFYKKGSKTILKKHYDVELLVTGKRGLSEKYQERKESTRKSESKTSSKNAPKKTTVKQSYTMKPAKTKEKGRISAFWIFVSVTSIISLVLLLFIALV